MKNVLHTLGNTPVSSSVIVSLYPDISGGNQKVAALENAGDIIRLKRGLYVVSPEKTPCDLIANTSGLNLRYLSETREYLENDLRLDMVTFRDFDPDILKQYAKCGKKSQSVETIIKLLQR